MKALLIGPGQLGRAIGGGLLACGVSLDVALRDSHIETWSQYDFVMVAVGEKDFERAVRAVPAEARNKLVLLQNDLVPSSWRALDVTHPTVLVVWFEKKKGKPAQVVRTSDLAGPHSALFARAFEAIDMPARVIAEADCVRALVVKNLYILASNAMGLRLGGGTTGSLVAEHRAETTRLLRELCTLERARLNAAENALLEDEALLEETFAAFASDPQHGLVGRTAKERVEKALLRAREAGVSMATLREFA